MNNQAWTSAGKDALWLSIPPVAAYALGNYLHLPGWLSFLVWSLKIFLIAHLLIRLTRRFGQDQSLFDYSKAFGYGFKICLLSSILCTAYFALDIFAFRPDFLAEAIATSLAALEDQGMGSMGIDTDSVIKSLPRTLTAVYFLYLVCCGILFSALTALVAKRPDNPFENQAFQDQQDQA